MWPVTCKYEVNQETGSTKRIATTREEDRATDIGNKHRQFGEDRTCGSGDMLAKRQTNRQTNKRTDGHTDHDTLLLGQGRGNGGTAEERRRNGV